MVLTVRRRGKYLLLELDRGLLLLHLGMSGSLVFARHLAAPGVHMRGRGRNVCKSADLPAGLKKGYNRENHVF